VEEKVHPEDVDPDVVRIRSQGCGTKIGQRDIVHLQAMLQKNSFNHRCTRGGGGAGCGRDKSVPYDTRPPDTVEFSKNLLIT
jgi:hypothetical protein